MTDWRLRERATLAGGKVAWDRFGEGAPIVLVHGTPSWSYLWRKVAPVLAERFSVYLLDLLGYGDSERREDQDISITAQGRLLAELLERWGLEAPGVVGHDIGGATVLRALLVEGRAAGRIALVDAVALNPWNTAGLTARSPTGFEPSFPTPSFASFLMPATSRQKMHPPPWRANSSSSSQRELPA